MTSQLRQLHIVISQCKEKIYYIENIVDSFLYGHGV